MMWESGGIAKQTLVFSGFLDYVGMISIIIQNYFSRNPNVYNIRDRRNRFRIIPYLFSSSIFSYVDYLRVVKDDDKYFDFYKTYASTEHNQSSFVVFYDSDICKK